jgi:hypothetical protein
MCRILPDMRNEGTNGARWGGMQRFNPPRKAAHSLRPFGRLKHYISMCFAYVTTSSADWVRRGVVLSLKCGTQNKMFGVI